MRGTQRLGDQSEAGLRVASEYRGRQWLCCDQALALTHSDEEYTNKSLSCFWCCLKCKFTVLLHLGEILIITRLAVDMDKPCPFIIFMLPVADWI